MRVWEVTYHAWRCSSHAPWATCLGVSFSVGVSFVSHSCPAAGHLRRMWMASSPPSCARCTHTACSRASAGSSAICQRTRAHAVTLPERCTMASPPAARLCEGSLLYTHTHTHNLPHQSPKPAPAPSIGPAHPSPNPTPIPLPIMCPAYPFPHAPSHNAPCPSIPTSHLHVPTTSMRPSHAHTSHPSIPTQWSLPCPVVFAPAQ